MIAVGLSSSILGCLVTLLIYSYCQRYQQQAHEATVIHPISAAPLNTSITNHINKLDKYDSVEAIKVCVHTHSQQLPSSLFTVRVSFIPLCVLYRTLFPVRVAMQLVINAQEG